MSRIRIVELEGPDAASVNSFLPEFPDSTDDRRPSGPILVSGGGLEAVLDRERPEIRWWGARGESLVRIEWVGAVGDASDGSLRAGPGAWTREWTVAGHTVTEEGLLPDGLPALVLRWRASGADGGSLPVQIRLRVDDRTHAVQVGERPVALALVDAGTDPDRARRFLRPLRARALQRAGRFRDEEGESGPLRVRWVGADGSTLRGLDEARHRLDAALPDPDAPRISRLGSPGRTPGLHAEVGLAQLLLGWHEPARRQLAHLTGAPTTHPHGLLHLAARWAQWTGRVHELLEFESALRAAARALEPGAVPPGGAAWPTAARLVHDLASAIERTGRPDWHKALLARSALLSPTPSPLRLPPVTAFPTGGRPMDSLLAARLVRSWIEGTLGAEPDAAWGRLTLRPTLGQDRPGEAPDPPALGLFEIRNLRVGDARIDLDCRRDAGRFTLRVAQTRGRNPLNLVCEPWVPLTSVERVTLGGEPADPERVAERGGTRVRLQFPLDPERRLIIDGQP